MNTKSTEESNSPTREQWKDQVKQWSQDVAEIYEEGDTVAFRWESDKTEWHGTIQRIQERHGVQYLTISCIYQIKLPSFIVVRSDQNGEYLK